MRTPAPPIQGVLTVLGMTFVLGGCGGGDNQPTITQDMTTADNAAVAPIEAQTTAMLIPTSVDAGIPPAEVALVHARVAVQAANQLNEPDPEDTDTKAAVQAAPDQAAHGGKEDNSYSAATAPTSDDPVNRLKTIQAVAVAAAATASVAQTASTQVTALAATPGVLLPSRVAQEDWANAKRLAASDAYWKYWVEGTRAFATKWFSVPRDRVELIAGYSNDYINPTTGAALSYSIDTPMPTNISTPAAVRTQQAWVAINRQYNISRALDAARLYKLTGDKVMAENAARQLDFYAANYLKWPLRTAVGNARMLGSELGRSSYRVNHARDRQGADGLC